MPAAWSCSLPPLLPILKNTAKWVHEAFEFFETALATRYPYTCYKQVFVDEAWDEMTSYSTLAVMNTTLLASSAVIDQTYVTRTVLTHAVATQVRSFQHSFFKCANFTSKD